MRPNKQYLLAGALAVALTSVAASSAFAQYPGYYGGRPGWYGRAQPTPYAGDCKFPYPRGYRADLKNWRYGFSDRDFSCFQLEDD
jgi:hypothetical protein